MGGVIGFFFVYGSDLEMKRGLEKKMTMGGSSSGSLL